MVDHQIWSKNPFSVESYLCKRNFIHQSIGLVLIKLFYFGISEKILTGTLNLNSNINKEQNNCFIIIVAFRLQKESKVMY